MMSTSIDVGAFPRKTRSVARTVRSRVLERLCVQHRSGDWAGWLERYGPVDDEATWISPLSRMSRDELPTRTDTLPPGVIQRWLVVSQ